MKCIIVFHLCRLSEWFTRDQLILLVFFSWYLRLRLCFAKNKYIPNSFYCEKNEMRTDVSVTIFFRMKINSTGINYTARSFWLLFSSVAVICLY